MEIGELINRKRCEKGMTQRDLACSLHVSSAAVSKWERGVNVPDLDKLKDLSELLEISSVELLGGMGISVEKTEGIPGAIGQKEDIGSFFIEDGSGEYSADAGSHWHNSTEMYVAKKITYGGEVIPVQTIAWEEVIDHKVYAGVLHLTAVNYDLEVRETRVAYEGILCPQK